ncbi:MAG: PAS domain-containing protein [Elusimicrobia bacterium]|nr:MAG: PAS domain-containing protein [Elusimicrobiota bacterium]KAF0155879.1 MAG: PAS domain-containing protein [Elusimicrobiota bacterium]
METRDDEYGTHAPSAGGGADPYPMSYPGLCYEFLLSLSKAVKVTALYRLSHPVVMEAVGKSFAILSSILAASRAPSLTISAEQENWLFNGDIVPSVPGESQNVAVHFKNHGLKGLTFKAGVRSFELGAVCEFFGTAAKNQPEGFFSEFMSQRGVENIKPESVRYVRAAVMESPAGAASPPFSPSMPEDKKPYGAGTGAGRQGVPSSAAPAPAPEGAADQGGALKSISLGNLVKGLVESSVKDPKARVHAYEEALGMIKDAMDKQVEEATRTMQAEKTLAINTRARTEQVLSTVAEGKMIIDRQGRILMMNPAAEAIAGKKFLELAGHHITEHIKPGEHFLALSEDIDLSAGRVPTGEVSVAGDESVEKAVRGSFALLEDDEGRVIGAYTTLPDIMKFKEAERLQEEFLSRITHDLQSPLSSITSALEMLTESAGTRLDQTEGKFLDISVRNSHRLVNMIKGILDFSKLQSGKMEVNPKPVPVSAIINEAGEGLIPWSRTRNISLVLRPPAPDLTVLADHEKMVQVLTNLISNAMKATPSGGTIIVAASPSPRKDGTAVIGVRDTGHGIAKEDLDKVFDKFVQIKSNRHRDGVGLGLAIVKEFIRLHGGRIWAVSEIGKGSTFYFTLPLSA